MFRPFRFVPAALAFAIALAGCSKTADSTAPPYLDQELADEIAQHVGMVLAGGTGGSMLSLTATAATIPAGGAISQDAARPARDTLFAKNGVAWVVVDTFFTAGNVPNDEYDVLATHASIHATANGEIVQLTSPAFRSTFKHRADLQFTGLSPVKDTIDFVGTARDSSRSTFTGKFSLNTIRLLIVASITHQNGIVMKGQDPLTPPLSAFSDWTVHAARFDNGDTTHVNREADTDVLIAFDGTGKATIEVGGLYSYQVDLLTGDLTRYGAQPIAGR